MNGVVILSSQTIPLLFHLNYPETGPLISLLACYVDCVSDVFNVFFNGGTAEVLIKLSAPAKCRMIAENSFFVVVKNNKSASGLFVLFNLYWILSLLLYSFNKHRWYL